MIEQVGRLLAGELREGDLAARWDGEKFMLLAPNTLAGQAVQVFEQLRRQVEDAAFEVPGAARAVRVTISCGVSCFPYDGASQAKLRQEAATAIYQAKLQGRNCVVSAREVPHANKLEQRGLLQLGAPGLGAAPAHLLPGRPGQAPVAERQPSPPAQPAAKAGAQRNWPLQIFVASVIACGSGVATVAALAAPLPELAVLSVLFGLAMLAELFQINVYDDNSMSVSLAIGIAAALSQGLVGVVAISAAIALADQIRQRRPARDLYKVAFNWATHTISGVAPVLALWLVPITVRIEAIPLLAIVVLVVSPIYYASDTLLISGAISLSRGARLLETWRTQFRWMLPHYLVLSMMGMFLSTAYANLGLVGILVFTLPVFMLIYAQRQYVLRTKGSVRELRRMNNQLTEANQEIVRASQAIQLLNDELLETLARFFDARDPYSGGHAAKVADYASAIALELGLAPERQKIVRQAALLHDIGKIAISEQVLFKAARLTAEEYEYIKTHAAIGAQLLEQSQGLRHLAPFVRYHHERWDGRGYPEGLACEQIPLEARILNVCDSVEAMASDRPYHRGMPLSEIMAEVRRCSGGQFDPAIAAAFIRVVERDGAELVVNSAYEVMQNLALKTPQLA